MPTSTKNDSPFNTPWFGVSMGLLGIIVGYALAVSTGLGSVAPAGPVANNPTPAPAQPTQPAAPSAKTVIAPDPSDDHIFGDETATISLIEYSDFECPFCGRVHPTMKQLVEQYDGDVNWVYRHYPLSFHPQAEPAAVASECIADLAGNDAFWAFNDAIFEDGNWDFEAIAGDAGIDARDFQDCIDSGKFTQKVADQMQGGQAAGVTGTPGTVVYNNKTKESRLVSGAQGIASFQSAIDALLE